MYEIHSDRISEVRFILLSPWTMTLCAELQSVLNNENDGEYFRVLADRLALVGKALIYQVRLGRQQRASG
jgi:hypothetical protein